MSIERIPAEDPIARSADVQADNIAQLKALFPELITEGAGGAAINVDVLKQLVGDATASDAEEKYGLNWHGKRRARQLALTPSTGTLRPCPEDSVDWDTTQNLMIEGDNLEVLKLLQKSYAGKVKLIYIDPPYNTGKDFVYPDNFQDSIKNYLELTGQVEGGKKISSNTEASGRFHTDWLNMMYPRLRLAKSLLKDEGLIFVSCDDHEISNIKALLVEVFGEDNSLGVMVWHARGRSKTLLSIDHEYLIAFGKDVTSLKAIFDKKRKGAPTWFGEPIARVYANPDGDSRGRWRDAQHTVTEGKAHYTYSINRTSGEVMEGQVINDFSIYGHRFWMYPPSTIKALFEDNRLVFTDQADHLSLKVKKFEDEDVPYTSLSGLVQREEISSRHGTEEVEPLMGARVFDYPKPTALIRKLIRAATRKNDLVIDFFAGSGTTGHAVMQESAADLEGRRFILVQLPERLDERNEGQKKAAAYCRSIKKQLSIAELTKERLRRAAAKVKADNPGWQGDTGFRVYKLDQSNIRAWQPSGDLEKDLVDSVEHIVPGRSEQDVLTELLLKLGLDLCVPIEQRQIAGKAVHAIGGGVLLACLDTRISRLDAEPLASGIAEWHAALAPAGETTCVFRDSAFENDEAKTNLAAILDQHGIHHVRSL